MKPLLDSNLVFDRFVVGSNNRLAATAARRAAEFPGRSYNPLVVCGSPGLGKTHLLTAIAHLAHAVDPDVLVQYERMESFIDRLSQSIAEGNVEALATARAGLGLWLLDDLQAVSGKQRTQEEIIRIWEGMIVSGAQVVVTCDRPLAEVSDLDPRLASRLSAGLIVDIGSPDPETRLGILRQSIAERGFPLPTEVIEALAALPIRNARELQGALNRVVAAVEIEGRSLDRTAVAVLIGIDQPAPAVSEDEFSGFVSDMASAVAAVVETAPWRRRLAEAILRWEAEGVRTQRLEAALDTDSAPDVDHLLSGFARDVARLRELARGLEGRVPDESLLSDPDRLAELENLVPIPRQDAPRRPPGPNERPGVRSDPWFLDRARFAWDWVGVEDRIMEEQR